jgi:hypothetical protein
VPRLELAHLLFDSTVVVTKLSVVKNAMEAHSILDFYSAHENVRQHLSQQIHCVCTTSSRTDFLNQIYLVETGLPLVGICKFFLYAEYTIFILKSVSNWMKKRLSVHIRPFESLHVRRWNVNLHKLWAVEFLCWDERSFQKDNHLCSTPPMRAFIVEWPDGSQPSVKGTWQLTWSFPKGT